MIKADKLEIHNSTVKIIKIVKSLNLYCFDLFDLDYCRFGLSSLKLRLYFSILESPQTIPYCPILHD